jgi:isochorismate synthase
MHLQTLFQGDLANIHSDWKKLSTLLYPTPAICGTDNEATLHLIKKVEKHKREYYTGILGPFNNMGQTDLFINLRCMKVIGNKSLLFAGGGILPESSAIEEWGETELKFSTLLQVIKFVHEKSKIE